MSLNKSDLEFAWRRLKLDRSNKRVFIQHPFLLSWVDHNLSQWLDELLQKIESGYTPHHATECEVPKAGGLIRHATVLDLQDEVIYNAITSSFHKKVWKFLAPFQ